MAYQCIYIMYNDKGEGYIGRNTEYQGRQYNRVWEHIRQGMCWPDGAQTRDGGAQLIYSTKDLSKIRIHIYDDPYFGVPPEVYENFAKEWVGTDPRDSERRLDFAEIYWIMVAGGPGVGYAKFNTENGSQQNFLYNNEQLLEAFKDINKNSTLYKTLQENSISWIAKYNNRSDIEMLRHPEGYLLQKLFALDVVEHILQREPVQNAIIKAITKMFTNSNWLSLGLGGQRDEFFRLSHKSVAPVLERYVNADLNRWRTILNKTDLGLTLEEQNFDFGPTIDDLVQPIFTQLYNQLRSAEKRKKATLEDVIQNIADVFKGMVGTISFKRKQYLVNFKGTHANGMEHKWLALAQSNTIPPISGGYDFTSYGKEVGYDYFCDLIAKNQGVLDGNAPQSMKVDKDVIMAQYDIAGYYSVNVRDIIWCNMWSRYLVDHGAEIVHKEYNSALAEPSKWLNW